jgi:hypothetical protein
VLENEAIVQLKSAVESNNELDFLQSVASATSNADLKELDFGSTQADYLWSEEAFEGIAQVAKLRLAALEKEAITALMTELKQYDNLGKLKTISAVTTNADLITGGLNPANVNKLNTEEAYQRFATEATAMIDANQKRIDALKLYVASSEDRSYLNKIVKCQNNEQFIQAIAHPLSTPPLLDTDDYRQFVDIARKQLFDLASRRQSVDAGTNPDVEVEPPIERPLAITEPQTEQQVVDQFAHMLMEEEGLLEFSEHKVKLTNFTEDLPSLRGDSDTPDPQPSVSAVTSFNFHYKGVHLTQGEVVRAHKVYTAPKEGQADEHEVTGVALLKQERTGTVHNMSYGEFTETQKTEIALKQAQMLLLNYRPKVGNNSITLRGHDADSANRVYAACLVLQEKHSHLRNVKIRSYVLGCTGPEYSLFKLDSSVRQAFIKKHLVSGDLEILAEQVTQTTDMRFKRFKEINELMKKDPSEADDYSLKEEDGVDSSGSVTRRSH